MVAHEESATGKNARKLQKVGRLIKPGTAWALNAKVVKFLPYTAKYKLVRVFVHELVADIGRLQSRVPCHQNIIFEPRIRRHGEPRTREVPSGANHTQKLPSRNGISGEVDWHTAEQIEVDIDGLTIVDLDVLDACLRQKQRL